MPSLEVCSRELFQRDSRFIALCTNFYATPCVAAFHIPESACQRVPINRHHTFEHIWVDLFFPISQHPEHPSVKAYTSEARIGELSPSGDPTADNVGRILTVSPLDSIVAIGAANRPWQHCAWVLGTCGRNAEAPILHRRLV